jgi:hypothetical protein
MALKKTWKNRPAELDPLPGETFKEYEDRVSAYAVANPGALTLLDKAAMEDVEARVQAELDAVGAEVDAVGRKVAVATRNVKHPAYAPSALHTTGAIGDGALHPLSEYFATLAEAQAVYPFATALTQTRDWAAFEKAWRSLPAPTGGVVEVPESSGDYRVEQGLTWNDRLVHWRGAGSGTSTTGTGTRVKFAAGQTGFNPRNGASVGSRSIIEGFHILGSDTAAGTNDGVRLQATSAKCLDCVIEGFGGYGLNILSAPTVADPTINANLCRVDSVRCASNKTGGFHAKGIDSNAGLITMLDVSDNAGWGVFEESFLGNAYFGLHTALNAAGDIRIGANSGRQVMHGVYCEDSNTPKLQMDAGGYGRNHIIFQHAIRTDGANPIVNNVTTGDGEASEIIVLDGIARHEHIQVGNWQGIHTQIKAAAAVANPTLLIRRGRAAYFYTPTEGSRWEVFNAADDGLRLQSSAAGGVLYIGNATRIGGNVGFNSAGPIAKPTVTGSRTDTAALTSLLTALANYGLITDSTTA